jgi:Zn ribbon nucleic-acid-binding protein
MTIYDCVRCGFSTNDKTKMRNHLFGRKECSSIKSDINLTDDIRENILTFGKLDEKNLKKKHLIEDGFIYILHPRACINGNQNVYKLGKTKDYIQRLKGYCKGSEYKYVIKISNFHYEEQKLLKLCREKFIERRDYGTEYFECALQEIYSIINENVNLIETQIQSTDIYYIIPYTCCRCGYHTKNKKDMRKHLYKKKICPALENDIELTDEIKEYILLNRIYKIPKPINPTTITNNNIKYNNTMNNYIKKMDSIDKLTKYMEYKDEKILFLEDDIENNLQIRLNNMENENYNIDENHLFDIIDEISKIKRGDLTHMNIIYNDKLKELNLYKSGCWESLILERGLKEVISIMKDIFFDHYEKYLFKQIYVSEKNYIKKQKYKEDVERHYKFLCCFDLLPFIQDKDDMDILGEEDGEFGKYTIEEKWMKIYTDITQNIKRYDINKMKKNISDILKNNTQHNIKDLNKNIIDLLNIDDDFKATLEL